MKTCHQSLRTENTGRGYEAGAGDDKLKRADKMARWRSRLSREIQEQPKYPSLLIRHNSHQGLDILLKKGVKISTYVKEVSFSFAGKKPYRRL